MVGDIAGDAGAKISALQDALLEELGNLKVCLSLPAPLSDHRLTLFSRRLRAPRCPA